MDQKGLINKFKGEKGSTEKPRNLPKPNDLLKWLNQGDIQKLVDNSQFASEAYVYDSVPFIIYLLQQNSTKAFKKIQWEEGAFEQKYLGNNVLNIATELNNQTFINLILKSNINSFIYENDSGINSLQIAIRNQNIEVIKFFLEKYKEATNGIDEYAFINDETGCGLFPIHFAAFTKNKEIIDLLLKIGANPYAKDLEGQMAIDYFDPNNDAELISYLKKEMLKYRIKSLLGKNDVINLKQPLESLIETDPDFIEDCIGKYKVNDLYQILCIHDNDLINKIFLQETKKVSYDEYQEFIRKYPKQEDDREIETYVKSLPEIIENTNTIRDMKNQYKKLPKEHPEYKAIHQQIKDMTKNLDSRIQEMISQEKRRRKQEEVDLFKNNPPSWTEVYINRCPILYRLKKAGYKLIHFIARTNNTNLFQYFLKNSSILTIDNEGRNILHHIAECGSDAILKQIQDYFDDKAEHILHNLYTQEDENGLIPYFTAIKYKHPDPLKFKENKYSKFVNSKHQNEFHIAVMYKNAKFISEKLSDFKSNAYDKDQDGNTPVDILCMHFTEDPFYAQIILVILYDDYCSNPTFANSFLMAAVKYHKTQLVKLLLQEGASATFLNTFNISPLHLAAYKRFDDIREILDPKGEIIQKFVTKDINGNTVQDILNMNK